MADGSSSPLEENMETMDRGKSRTIRRVKYLRCLSTPGRLTLSRQSSIICTQSFRRTSGLVSVQLDHAGSQEVYGGECFFCSHRELPALLDEPIDIFDQSSSSEEDKEAEEMEGAMKIPFQNHPALEPSTSFEPDLELECCICFNRRDTVQMTHVSCVLMPCQHHQLCLDCANQVEMCPLCREQIELRIPVEANASSVTEMPQKCLMRQLSGDSREELPYRRKWQTALTVLLCLILSPAVFIGFHYIWSSWNIVKILIGAFLSGIVACFAAVITDRCYWRQKNLRTEIEVSA